MSFSQRYFATLYDSIHGLVEGRIADYRRRTAGRATGDVLEIGGGSGANLRYYPDDARITMAEPNPHMVTRLQRRASKLGREVVVVPDRGEELSFADGSFDSVVTTLTLCMVDDLPKVLSEARRVLRTDGAFYYYEHVVSESAWVRRLQRAANPAWRFATTGCNLDRDTVSMVRAAGFASVEVERFTFSVGLPITLPNVIGVARV